MKHTNNQVLSPPALPFPTPAPKHTKMIISKKKVFSTP